MKLCLIAFVGFASVLFLSLLNGGRLSEGEFTVQDKVVLEPAASGKVLTGTVLLKNDTNREVVIQDIRADCGCMTISNAAVVRARTELPFQFKILTPETYGVFRHNITFVAGATSYKVDISGKVNELSPTTRPR